MAQIIYSGSTSSIPVYAPNTPYRKDTIITDSEKDDLYIVVRNFVSTNLENDLKTGNLEPVTDNTVPIDVENSDNKIYIISPSPLTLEVMKYTREVWETTNPVLGNNQLGIELDDEQIRFKLGDGITHWLDLPYILGQIVPTDFDFSIRREEFVTIDKDDDIRGIKTFEDTVIFKNGIRIEGGMAIDENNAGVVNPAYLSTIRVEEGYNRTLVGPIRFDSLFVADNAYLKII